MFLFRHQKTIPLKRHLTHLSAIVPLNNGDIQSWRLRDVCTRYVMYDGVLIGALDILGVKKVVSPCKPTSHVSVDE